MSQSGLGPLWYHLECILDLALGIVVLPKEIAICLRRITMNGLPPSSIKFILGRGAPTVRCIFQGTLTAPKRSFGAVKVDDMSSLVVRRI